MQAERAKRAKRRRLSESLADFFREGFTENEPATPLDWNWHLDAMCLHIQALLEDWMRVQMHARGRLPECGTQRFRLAERLGLVSESGSLVDGVIQRMQNCIENVPPGSMKSRIVSVYTTPWVWLSWPEWKAIFLSINPRVVLDDSVRCRDVLRSRWYRDTFAPDWDFAEDQDAKGSYKNTRGGFRKALGYFAEMVGDRGDALFVDDPNDPEKVQGDAHRNAVNGRWDGTLRNRVNDLRTSVRFIIQQRCHVRDLTGFILSEYQDYWAHLRIPMEMPGRVACECTDCRRGETGIGWKDPREPGALMFPKRFPEKVLADFRAKSNVWTSQYQQAPVAAAGNLFRETWWRFWRFDWEPEVPELADRTVVVPDSTQWAEHFEPGCISGDMTFKKTKAGSKVAIGAWAMHGAGRFLLGLRWDRMGFTESKANLRELSEEFPWIALKLIEEKANGAAVIDSLTEGAEEDGKDPVTGLVGEQVEGSKQARAWAVSPLVEAGNVYLPLHAAWRAEAIAECSAFPDGENDDFVDQMTQALRRMQTPSWMSRYR